jgi:hypothetical protein
VAYEATRSVEAFVAGSLVTPSELQTDHYLDGYRIELIETG